MCKLERIRNNNSYIKSRKKPFKFILERCSNNFKVSRKISSQRITFVPVWWNKMNPSFLTQIEQIMFNFCKNGRYNSIWIHNKQKIFNFLSLTDSLNLFLIAPIILLNFFLITVFLFLLFDTYLTIEYIQYTDTLLNNTYTY